MRYWQTMCANTEGYSGLHEELRNCRGRYVLEEVKMPESCGSQICTIEFQYYGEDYIQMICLDAPIAYNGSNSRIAQWLENGTLEFGSFDQLTAFLRQFNEEQTSLDNGISRPISGKADNLPFGHQDSPGSQRRITMPETRRSELELARGTREHLAIDLERLVDDVSETVRGQEEAIRCVGRYACAAVTKRYPKRLPSVVLVGATGQGKTLLGKTLAEALNNQITDPNRKYGTIRVQCNELTEDHNVSRLLGGSPNYVGYGDDNLLTPVLANPYQVIIFDEIEKAAPRVLDILMGALDCGEIMMTKPVDGKNMLDLKHCIILFTSNLPIGKNEPHKHIGFAPGTAEPDGDMSTRYRNALVAQGLRREIVARFSDIVCFRELKAESEIDIILLEIQNCAGEYGFGISYVSPEILQGLYDEIQISGFDARMIQRAVSNRFDLFFGESPAAGSEQMYELIGNYADPVLRCATLHNSCVNPHNNK